MSKSLMKIEPESGFRIPVIILRVVVMMREHADAGNSVLFSTHVLEVAEKLCDKVIIINHGKSEYNGKQADYVKH